MHETPIAATCPMCGATPAPNASWCLSCGEVFFRNTIPLPADYSLTFRWFAVCLVIGWTTAAIGEQAWFSEGTCVCGAIGAAIGLLIGTVRSRGNDRQGEENSEAA